jgi:hypothetical protein
MKINETRKGKYNKIILKEKRKKQITAKKKQNREQKKREKKTYSNEKKPYLKKNEVCPLFPNFKHASKQTKIQKFKGNTLFLLY